MRPFTFASLMFLLALTTMLWAPRAHAAAGEPEFGFYAAPEIGAAPLEVHFHPFGNDSLIGSISNWSWDFGDGTTDTEGYTTHEYSEPGAYTVTLTATSSNGRTYTASRENYVRVTSGEAANMTVEPPEESRAASSQTSADAEAARPDVTGPGDGLVFLHHSCGENWLNSGLHNTLMSKDYIQQRNDITYGVTVDPDPGRPASLGPVAGELTDMHHWILWFNDYLGNVKRHGCDRGANRIVMFKSCFPNSHVEDAGTEPGDPFSDWKTETNYKAVYRHPSGPGNTYSMDGVSYHPLEDIFAANPQTLFVIVTAPPECWNDTNSNIAAHARRFNEWLQGEWLPEYVQTTGLNNVAVFDWFDILAYPVDDASHPNQLRGDYGGGSGDSHPNDAANQNSTRIFATDRTNWLDRVFAEFQANR